MPTGIEWTDETWNPVVGCSRVSPGCDNCYAERDAGGRLKNVPAYRGTTQLGKWTGKLNVLDDRMTQPLRWERPRRIFVNSMSDLFHPEVDDLTIARVFAVMSLAPQHVFQVLTKRPKAMAGVLSDPEGDFRYKVNLERRRILLSTARRRSRYPAPETVPRWPLLNVWLGTSIESQAYAFRARHLAETPAAIRFISAEPLLGPLDLSEHLDEIDWVIVGGESGPNARPMHPSWARSLRDQCQGSPVQPSTAFLFKQWGEYRPLIKLGHAVDLTLCNDGHVAKPTDRQMWLFGREPVAMHRYGKHQAGRDLDGRTWDEYPADPRQLLINIL